MAQRCRTCVRPKTLNPQWNETFEFSGVLRDLLAEALQLSAEDEATLLERAWTCVGTSEQNLFESNEKVSVISVSWPSSTVIAARLVGAIRSEAMCCSPTRCVRTCAPRWRHLMLSAS